MKKMKRIGKILMNVIAMKVMKVRDPHVCTFSILWYCLNPKKGDGRMCVDINECTGFLSGSNMPCDENAKDGFGNNSCIF